jgi:hypothetical protein
MRHNLGEPVFGVGVSATMYWRSSTFSNPARAVS